MNRYTKEYIETFSKSASTLDDIWQGLKHNFNPRNAPGIIGNQIAGAAKGVWGWGSNVAHGLYDGAVDTVQPIADAGVKTLHDLDGTNGAMEEAKQLGDVALLNKRKMVMDQAKSLGYKNDKEYLAGLRDKSITPGEVKRVAPVSLPSQHADAHPGMLHSVALDRARDNVAREAQQNAQLKAESDPKAVLYKGTAPGTTYASQDGRGSVTFLPPHGGQLPAPPSEQGGYRPVFAGDPKLNGGFPAAKKPFNAADPSTYSVPQQTPPVRPNEYDPSREPAMALNPTQKLYNTNKRLT